MIHVHVYDRVMLNDLKKKHYSFSIVSNSVTKIICQQKSWNLGETSSEVQNRGIGGPTKRAYVLQN